MQEVHNKCRQTQEAGHAVVLRSYFSSSLLPSQAEGCVNLSSWTAIGRHQKSRKPTLHFRPLRSQKTTSSNLFPEINPYRRASALQKSFDFEQIHTPLQPYTSLSTEQGVMNISSEAFFLKITIVLFFEWSTAPTPSFLSFSLLLFSRFHLCIPRCPLSTLF